MKIELPQLSPHREPPSGVPRDGFESMARRASRAGSSVLLALLLACGGSSEEEPIEPEGCASDAECVGGQQCVDAACVAPSPPSSASAGVFACTVIDCPASQPDCCVAAEVTATGNESQGYVIRNEMVQGAHSFPGEVRANFSFDAADQQGWVTFQLGAELDLERIDFTGRVLGEADHFLSVNTNSDADVGCAFGFELELRPPPTGQGPFVFGNDNISVDDNDFCYGGARPGRARQLAFAIFSLGPGDASLIITNIVLR